LVTSPLVFGEFAFDPSARLLVRGRVPIHLTPKAMELLILLAERGPRPVSKEEIHERVWPGVFVSDASLTALIFDLRNALRESARKPRYIRTVHGFGYAFVPDEGLVAFLRPPCRLVVDGRGHDLVNGENLVGRSIDCAVRIESTDVSRRHARIVVEGTEARVEDCGSTNGTFVRGERIAGVVPLADGDEVRFGSVAAVFRNSPEEPQTDVR
jgi:DNA-binding winged helix-turn-helix (wHTH) protein